MFKTISFFFLTFTLAVTLSGCGRNVAVEKNLQGMFGDDAKVAVDGDEIKVTTEDGSLQVGGKVTLPADFPTDVYVIDGQIMSAAKNAYGNGAYQVVVRVDSQDITATKDLYQQKLTAAGWKITSAVDMGNAAMVAATKGEMTASVTMGTEEDEEGMAVIITVGANSNQ